MAAIIELPSATPGLTLYCHIRSASGQLWNGTAFETFNGSNWSNYVNSVVEDRSGGIGSGYYKGIFPPTVGIGKYTEVFYQQIGSSPALGDSNIGSGQIYWTGTIEEQGVFYEVQNFMMGSALPELTGVPPATPTVYQALMLLYMSLRNQHTATSTTETIGNSVGSTIASATVSDNGTVYTKGSFS